MDITGKLVIFSKQKENTVSFSTSVSRKLESGKYDSVSLNVFFNGELKDKAQSLPVDHKFTLEDVIGFISCYKNKIQVFITNCRITEKQAFTRKEKTSPETLDDLPF